MSHSQRKRGLQAFASVLVGTVATGANLGCESAPQARPAPPVPKITAVEQPADQDDAWSSMEHMLDPGQSAGQPPRTAASPGTQRPPIQSAWHALVLQTFPGDNDGRAATLWRDQLAAVVPPIAEKIRVHVGSKGSMVLYGQYEDWDDPQASTDMEFLRNVRVNNKRIFGPIVRTEVQPRRDPASIHPHELLAVRQQFPDGRTVYTLEIEVWGDFDSGMLSDTERQSRVEAKVASLRGQGVPAYFHHDPISDLSMITVGVFGEQALDPASGLLSSEVEQWQRRFPNRLTNGEELRLPVQGQPDLGVVPQRTRLVLVPELQ